MAKVFNKASWTAIILILVGSILLLNNLNLLPTQLPSYFLTWKMLLMVVGVIALFNRAWFPGFALIGIGQYFLLPEMYGIPKPDVMTMWPVLLIFIGLMIFFHNILPPKKKKIRHWRFEKRETTSDYMNNTVIFGGDSQKLSSYNFQGGKIETILGGLEVDLTNCCLSKGENIIDATIVLGGVTLTVPKEWNIILKMTPIMGGVFDEAQMSPDSYVDPAAQLTIIGTTVMGGLEIKRV